MKILVIMNSVDVAPGGGIVQVILNYARETCKMVDLDFAINERQNSGLREKFREFHNEYYNLPNKKKNLIKYVMCLYKIFKNGRYDVIHVHGNSANMVIELMTARLAGIKERIAHCHNTKCSYPLLNNLLKPIFQKQYTHAIACSKAAGDWLFGENKFTVLRNGIDASKYEYNEEYRKEYRNRFGVSDDTLLLGNVGNLTEQKNQSFLISVIKSLKSMRKVKLIIIGEGSYLDALEQQIEESGLKEEISILGHRDDINKCLSAFDCFVLPSKWEGLPLVLIEAQASGLPCMVSDRVSTESKLEGSVLFFLPFDENMWLDQLMGVEINNDRSKGKEIVIRGGYNIETEAAKLLEIYQ